MLILYTKDNCGYCDKVKYVFLEKNVSYEERNIKQQEYLEEAQGHGARTMPMLFDSSANTTIKESDEIIDYISEYAF